MGNNQKADLILHPARLRVLLELATGNLTTQELAARLSDLPRPSLYRHLRQLLEGGLISITATRPVRGVQEKVYALAQPPHLDQADFAGLDPKGHAHYFASFLANLLQDFTAYINTNASQADLLADRTGYTQAIFFASQAELDHFRTQLMAALAELAGQKPAPGRHAHKLAIISHPMLEESHA